MLVGDLKRRLGAWLGALVNGVQTDAHLVFSLILG